MGYNQQPRSYLELTPNQSSPMQCYWGYQSLSKAEFMIGTSWTSQNHFMFYCGLVSVCSIYAVPSHFSTALKRLCTKPYLIKESV